MKNIQNKLIVLLFIAFAFPQISSSQDSVAELNYEVNKVYPFISITKERLNDAQTLIDLNSRYKTSWVRTYLSVEVLTSYEGKIKRAVSKNDTLSQEQKDIMKMADVGKDISVKVIYMPENTLTHNDRKEINFTFTVNPDKEATYSGGQQQLQEYLKENAIDKIAAGSFQNYDLAIVKFTIDKEGQIVDPHVSESSKDEKIDELLLKTICNMPSWEPAEYANGTKVKEEYVLFVGNMENCMTNLFNTHRLLTKIGVSH